MDWFKVLFSLFKEHLPGLLFLVIYLRHGINELAIGSHTSIDEKLAVDFESAGINTTANRSLTKLDVFDLPVCVRIIDNYVVHDEPLISLLILVARSLTTKKDNLLIGLVIKDHVAHPSNHNIISISVSVVFQRLFLD